MNVGTRYPFPTDAAPGARLIGNNALHLNTATMIAAVQILLDASHREGHAPVVTTVEYNPAVSAFIVKTEERKE